MSFDDAFNSSLFNRVGMAIGGVSLCAATLVSGFNGSAREEMCFHRDVVEQVSESLGIASVGHRSSGLCAFEDP